MVRFASDNARVEATRDEIVDHVCADEEKGIQLLDMSFEFDVLLKLKFLFHRLEGVVCDSTCE